MQGAKKCGQCNVLNEAGRIYCKNCGKYLKIAEKKEERVTIWGTDAYVSDVQWTPGGQNGAGSFGQGGMMTGAGAAHMKAGCQKQAVICPQCGQQALLTDGLFPLACVSCGYFFQAGLDPVVTLDAAGQVQGGGAMAGTSPQGGQSAGGQDSQVLAGQGQQGSQFSAGQHNQSTTGQKKAGPLGRAPRDNSQMRLFSLTSPGMMPEVMTEAGNILGKDATVFKQLRSDQQVSIWHTPTGWYARALQGSPYYNGVPMNTGIQLKLSDGDLLNIGTQQLRVEILQNR